MAFDKNYDHLLKVLLTGDSSVGKTSLICQFVDNETRQTHIATIGKSTVERDPATSDGWLVRPAR